MADEGPAVYHTAARGQGKAPGLRSTAAKAEAKAWDCSRYGSLQITRTAPLAPGLLACSPLLTTRLLSAPEASHAQLPHFSSAPSPPSPQPNREDSALPDYSEEKLCCYFKINLFPGVFRVRIIL